MTLKFAIVRASCEGLRGRLGRTRRGCCSRISEPRTRVASLGRLFQESFGSLMQRGLRFELEKTQPCLDEGSDSSLLGSTRRDEVGKENSIYFLLIWVASGAGMR